MSSPDDGTTEFKVGGLRDLLEGGEPSPEKGKGGLNRQLLLIGGGVAAVLVVLLAVVLVAGGGDDDDEGGTNANGFPGIVELKKGVAVGSSVREGATVSICDTATAPIAEGVVVKKMSEGKGPLGSETVIIEVEGTAEQANRINVKPTSTWKVFATPTCPPANTTPASSDPTTATSATPPPQPTPPETAPTPPAS